MLQGKSVSREVDIFSDPTSQDLKSRIELEWLREKFDENYKAWSPDLPYEERERLTRENRRIFNRILELNQQGSPGQVGDKYSFGRFRR